MTKQRTAVASQAQPNGQVVTEVEAAHAVKTLLRYLGENPDRAGLVDTPKRVAKALWEMTRGVTEDPADILSRTFEEEQHDEVVILKGISFESMCEHHLLPFTGTADVGYIPGKVVGLSKLARLVDCYARRLQMQERMARQIANAIQEYLDPLGVAVVLRGHHACLSCRGAKKPGSVMVTSVMTGIFRQDQSARMEFLELCKQV